MCVSKIVSLFRKPKVVLTEPEPTPVTIPEIPIPDCRRIVTWDFLFNILNNAHPTAPHIYMRDNNYVLCTKDSFQVYLDSDPTNKEAYIPEEHDCDDFTYEVMGATSKMPWSKIAKGIIWTNLHAFMVFIDYTGKLWYVEPQNDQIVDRWELYFGSEITFIAM